MWIELGPGAPLRLRDTLDSGQVFCWQEEGGVWYGTLRSSAVAIREAEDALEVQTAGEPLGVDEVRAFLGLDDPLSAIRDELSARDPVLQRAFAACYGLRVVRQDPWEGLVAFICSSRNAVFRIQQMMACLARTFGEPLRVRGHELFTFPGPERLAGLRLADLMPCRLGYRDAYVLEAARKVHSGEIDLSALVAAPYAQARELLLTVPGVGPKVADCVLLMALGHKESAFPVDVWIRRAILRYYRDAVSAATGIELASEEKSLTERQHQAIVRWAQSYFAPHVGYAQTYLFFATRSGVL